ncbi:hypothetical protein HPB47_008481 [Ixodes persulcatus]|uniref:Uncharacterized protein n=1 Tax=Ixodes persulcatus TaxID=34615 RepID=A0AC60P4K5_IXOPE|nr:hypothetical protein HPB47_008481 [Ixodes persulcatus]
MRSSKHVQRKLALQNPEIISSITSHARLDLELEIDAHHRFRSRRTVKRADERGGRRVQSRTQNLAYRMMVNQTDLMAPHESPYSTEEQFMYEPTEEDKNAYCNLQPIGLDTSDHVTPCLQHTMDLMPPSRPIPFEGKTLSYDT